MYLTDFQKKETGAFYTPKIWADLAVDYIRKIIPCLEDFVFLDPCCGEGHLLDSLPKNVEKYGSTLEKEDVLICKEKGHNVVQLDFLKDDVSNLIPKEKNERLIVFTNPPYVKYYKDKYNIQNKYKTNDSVALFYYKILNDLDPVFLCSFNKVDLYQAAVHDRFRRNIRLFERTLEMFVCNSRTWGLKGNFPIAFNILMGGKF